MHIWVIYIIEDDMAIFIFYTTKQSIQGLNFSCNQQQLNLVGCDAYLVFDS